MEDYSRIFYDNPIYVDLNETILPSTMLHMTQFKQGHHSKTSCDCIKTMNEVRLDCVRKKGMFISYK